MRVLIAERREDGAVAVLVAILAVVLLGIVAFTTDFGMAYAQRRALSTGVDSAALGVAHAKYTSAMANRSATCADLVTADTALAPGASTKASNIAWAQVKANSPFEANIPASDVTTTLSCVGVGILQVTVVVDRTMNPIFGGALGAGSSQMKLNRQAVAALGVSNEVGNLVPIALCKSQADAIKASGIGAPPYPVQKVPLSKVWGGSSLCGTAANGAGNWGWLKFDGQGNGEPGLEDALKNHNGRIALSGVPPHYEIAGVPGNKANGNPVQAGLTFLNDTTVTIPVYGNGTISSNGQNATYTIVGFLSVKICGYKSGNKIVENACYDSTPALKLVGDDEMQVQFINYLEAGKMAETCAIGGTCSLLPLATKLVG